MDLKTSNVTLNIVIMVRHAIVMLVTQLQSNVRDEPYRCIENRDEGNTRVNVKNSANLP